VEQQSQRQLFKLQFLGLSFPESLPTNLNILSVKYAFVIMLHLKASKSKELPAIINNSIK